MSTITDQDGAARLFDASWYLEVYPDVAGQDPLEHFRRVGAAEGRDPNPMFSTAWYRQRYPDVADSCVNPLEDFVSRGVALGRDPGPLFSTQWYLTRYSDVAAAGANPLEHYLHWVRIEGRDPTPVFDTAWYLMTYPQTAAPGVDARLHYMRQGAALNYDPSPWFQTGWYLATYPDVAASGENPLLHYLTKGAQQGCDPSPTFSSVNYIAENRECAESGDNPLVHYLIQQLFSATVISPAAIAATKALIKRFANVEPELSAIPKMLDTLPSRPLAPDRSMSSWRALYLSLYDMPKQVLLVGCIDDEPELAEAVAARDGLLIVETDTREASTAEALPHGTEWRSLAEFAVDLDFADRLRIVAALANHLQPETLMVWGSRIGWEVLTRYGAALRRYMTLTATTAAAPDFPADDLLRDYLRDCLPALSALYTTDAVELERITSRFWMPPKEQEKLQMRHTSSATSASTPAPGLTA